MLPRCLCVKYLTKYYVTQFKVRKYLLLLFFGKECTLNHYTIGYHSSGAPCSLRIFTHSSRPRTIAAFNGVSLVILVDTV